MSGRATCSNRHNCWAISTHCMTANKLSSIRLLARKSVCSPPQHTLAAFSPSLHTRLAYRFGTALVSLPSACSLPSPAYHLTPCTMVTSCCVSRPRISASTSTDAVRSTVFARLSGPSHLIKLKGMLFNATPASIPLTARCSSSSGTSSPAFSRNM